MKLQKSNRPQETHKLEMEWRYQLVLFKGVRISMFLAATLAPSRLKQNLRHSQNTAYLAYTKTTTNCVFQKRLLPCLGLVLQNQLALLTNSLICFVFSSRRWVQEELTHVWQYKHLSKILSKTSDPGKLRPKFSVCPSKWHVQQIYHICFLII